MKNIRNIAGVFGIVFFLAGCMQMLDAPSPKTENNGETGFVRLSLMDAERTLRPEGFAELAIVRYTLTFSSTSGALAAPVQADSLAAFAAPIELRPGTWTLNLSGFTADGNPLASGSVTIAIAAGKTANASITLLPCGEGSFDYSGLVSLFASQPPQSAALAISALEGGAVQSINLLLPTGAENPGLLDLPAGYYRISVEVYTADSMAVKTDLVYIYNNALTRAAYTLADFNFVPVQYAAGAGLAEQLTWITANAAPGGSYIVSLAADENAFAPAALSYSGKKLSIRLFGNGHTVKLAGTGSLFTLGSGLTLITKDVILHGPGPDTSNSDSLVKVNSGASLILEAGSVVSGNHIIDRGQYQNARGAGVRVNGGELVLNGGEISGNFINNYEVSGRPGGGVYVDGGSFIMHSGLVSENNSEDNGGGVYVYNGSFTMNGGAITGNSGDYGGGVRLVGSGSTMTMYGGEISGNSADYGGGVITNHITMYGGKISGNSASQGGGGAYLWGDGMTMYGGEISGNSASNGGGVYAEQNNPIIIYDGSISGNTAFSGIGGIYSFDSISIHNGTISGNTGGGVSGNQITLHDGEISNNSGRGISGGLTMYGGKISGNRGGVRGALIMHGGEISGNTALDNGYPSSERGYGGGAWLSSDSFLYDGEISGNSSTNYGGGIYVAGGTFTQTGGRISGNQSTGKGSAVALMGDTVSFVLQDGVITGNTSTYLAAGTIYGTSSNANGTIMINGGSVFNNKGSGVVTEYGFGRMEINGGEIKGNSGLGVMIEGGYTDTLIFNSGDISNNGERGVYFNGLDFTMNGGSIRNNQGSGVYLESFGADMGAAFTMNGGSISGNTSAENGGGVWARSSRNTITINGGVIASNTAAGQGGGVYVPWRAVFIKALPEGGGSGGIIYGSETSIDAALRNHAQTGAALYWYDGSKKRNTTIGADTVMYLSTDNDHAYPGWE